ncbi:hypothetical protein FQN57_004990 [Myotisia sp. PD_48]|nr:hypothetical protein FQN57_004990 [Myotisia sp. PD_48]
MAKVFTSKYIGQTHSLHTLSSQKAAKTLAAKNSTFLRTSHITTAVLHAILLVLHFAFNRPRSLLAYAILSSPTIVLGLYFEKIGRPRYKDTSLQSPGEDLDAPGLTEYFRDVLYWSWGCMAAACIFGDYAWWFWVAVPVYSVWLGYSTFMGVRKGFTGMDADAAEQAPAAESSKRQKKMEKRGGQKVVYR